MIEEYNLSFLNLKVIEERLLKIRTREHGLVTQGISSYNYGMPLLEYPEFDTLKKIIYQYIKFYCKQHNIPKLNLINSWFNISHPGNKLKPHKHEESVISGAFYVSVGKKSVPLIFPDKLIKPYPGLLTLFSSDLTHYTKAEKEKRIVISFNTDYI